jgi:ketosteroid isomerase-like protein
MKRIVLFLFITTLSILCFSCNRETKNAQPMNDQSSQTEENIKIEEIRQANDLLYTGLNAMFTGNLEILDSLWSHSNSITYMGPFGACIKGWDNVSAEFQKVASMKLGGKIKSNDLTIFVGTDIGYTSCVEEGENIDTNGNPVKVSHRATNIFHLENGKWRLVHHHTDISNPLEEAYSH